MNKIITLLSLISLIVISGCSDYARGEVCGTHKETYTSSATGCDKLDNCECIHNSWGGLGACDSCKCTKDVSNC